MYAVPPRLNTLLNGVQRYRWPLLALALSLIAAAVLSWLVELDTTVQARMSSQQQWPLPARVYARPLELFAGKDLTLDALSQELQWLGYRKMTSIDSELQSGEFSRDANTVRIYTRGFSFSDGIEHPQQLSVEVQHDTVTSVTDNNKEPAFIRLEPLEIGSIHPGQHEDRVLVTMATMPPGFSDALIAVEDRNFRHHHGISLRGIARAVVANLKSGSRGQGASTLTQQLVKNLFLSPEKTWERKITEMLMAIIMDFRYTKDEILEAFSNEVFIAQDGNRAIHGFGLASRYFFDRPFNELLPHDYAVLIGMLKAPSRLNPVRHPERAQNRRDLVLGLMHKYGDLSPEDRDSARSQPLTLGRKAEQSADYAPATFRDFTQGNPAFMDAVSRQLLEEYDSNDLQSAGLRIFTNYDPLVQYEAEQSVGRTFQNLATRFGESITSEQALEVAVVVTEPNTGEVKAMIGGRKARYAGFNRALDASRPVGSLLKPAIFLTALESPAKYSLASLIDDAPIKLELPSGDVWEPSNFDGTSSGPVMAIEALSRSLNLASVNLGLDLGLPKVIDSLHAMGIDTTLPEVPALLLGAHGFSVMDMTRMYQTIAADGFSTPLRTIREVVDNTGNTLTEYPINIEQRFDGASIYQLKYAMATAMISGTGRSVSANLPPGFNVAGKTGTSDDQRDSWFAGFSGDYLSVVWIGNDDNLPTPLTGSSGALAVWKDLFGNISKKPLDLRLPDSIGLVNVDPASGKRVRDSCDAGIRLPFTQGSEPRQIGRCPSRKGLNAWFRSLLR